MRKNIAICILIFAIVFSLTACYQSFKITNEMKDFRERIVTLEAVKDVDYFFEGRPHSSWGIVAIVINVDCDTLFINDDLVLRIFSLFFESNQLRTDISNQDAVEYAITFRNSDTSENILGFTTTDRGNSDLDEWYTVNGDTLSFANDEIIITYYDGEIENHIISVD